MILDAAKIISAGGVIAFRTDTFYGLGADPLNAAAVSRIRELKGREDDKPILLLLSDASIADRFITDVSEAFAEVARKFWPGPLTIVGTAFLLFAGPLIRIFSSDPDVIGYGVRCRRMVAIGFLFYGYGMALTGAFNGAGDTRTPTLINLFCLWMLEIPLAWVLAYPLGFGPTGVFTSVSVAFSVLALVSAVLFKRGKWKLQRV